MAQRELAGVAIHQIQTYRQDDVDSGQHEDVHSVIIELWRHGIEGGAGGQTGNKGDMSGVLLHGIRPSRVRTFQGVRLV